MPRKKQPDSDTAGWNGFAGLEKRLEHRVRLALCVLLSRHGRMNFRRLRELLDETDGSLGAHLKSLEEAGFVSVEKAFEARKPISWYGLTRSGKAALSKHVRALDEILKQAKPSR